MTQKFYINRRQGADIQTISQHDSRLDALRELPHKRRSRRNTGAYVYVTTRCTNEWRRAHAQ